MKCLIAVLALCAGAICARNGLTVGPDATGVIFMLGRFDGSSQEFNGGSPGSDVRVPVSEHSDPSLWYSFQPVSGSLSTGPIAGRPRSVTFSLTEQPAEFYTLKVSLLIEHASVPALRVSINGSQGMLYLSPQLDSRVGDGGAVSFPSFAQATVVVEVPGALLHRGQNEISFSVVDEDHAHHVPDAGLNYDAISLSAGAPINGIGARVQPTVFYKRIAGRLEEAVNVVVPASQSSAGTATLTIHGKRFPIVFPQGAGWGERNARLYVPAFDADTAAALSLNASDGAARTLNYTLQPAKRWTVYIVPHVHLDIGYTDFQAKVASVQGRVIDEALDLIANHPDFRFSMDGMWSLDQFLSTRTPADIARAVAAMKAKELFVPADYSNELTGFASTEALIRSLYPSANFSREHNTPLNYASITDVPSYSWSYASILAAAGIHELVAGSNNGRAPVLLRGHLDEQSPFYWEGPDGKRVLMWYSRHYHQMWTIFGLPPLIDAGEETLPLFLQMYGRPTYKASSTIVYGSQVENTDLYPQQADLVQQWNQHYAYPHLEYSGFHHALTSVAAEFHGELATVRGDGGPYWEDGIAADAYYAAMERENEVRALSAEKLSTIDALVNPRMAVDRRSFSALWKDIVLMDEHTWLSAESYSDSVADQATVQLGAKDERAMDAHHMTDWLMRRSMANLADSIDTPPGSLIVFNTLNWARSGLVSVDIRRGMHLVDPDTKQDVAETVTDHGENTQRVNFWADSIPAVGYKTYLMEDGPGSSLPAASTSSSVLENQYYRLTLDPSTGAVRSLYDKQLRHEIVSQESPYRFGEYLYVSKSAEHPFAIQGARAGRLMSLEQTTEGPTATIESTDVNTPKIVSTITLASHSKQVLFDIEIDKRPTKQDEAVYIAFPFAMAHPEFRYEIQNGVVDPAHDMYPGAGYDWFSVQHWAGVQQDGVAAAVMPLDASLMTFGDITRLKFPSSFGTRPGTIFSYVMNNYWHTNYRAEQGGHFRFRYVVTSGSTLEAPALSRTGWEAMTPFEVDEVTGSDKAVTRHSSAGPEGSFLQADDPALVLETWKPAEDGRGTILRFVDLGGRARKVHVRLPEGSIEHAWLDDALERDQSFVECTDAHTVTFPVMPHSIVTLRVLRVGLKSTSMQQTSHDREDR